MITLQNQWWKGHSPHAGTPDDMPCKDCDHLTKDHDIKRSFLWSEGKFIGRKSIAHCKECDCIKETYVEICEDKREEHFWAIASKGLGFEEFGRLELTKEELTAFLKKPLSMGD